MSDVTTIDINHIYRDSKFSQIEIFSLKIVFICNECKLKQNFFCIDLSKYRLITFFWNSLPMIFKKLQFPLCIYICKSDILFLHRIYKLLHLLKISFLNSEQDIRDIISVCLDLMSLAYIYSFE